MTSCRPPEPRLPHPSSSNLDRDPHRTPTPRHGPWGVHSHVFFRPSDLSAFDRRSIAVRWRGRTRSTLTRTSDLHEPQIRIAFKVYLCTVPRIILRNRPRYGPWTNNFHMHPVVNTSTPVPTHLPTNSTIPQTKTTRLSGPDSTRLHRLLPCC